MYKSALKNIISILLYSKAFQFSFFIFSILVFFNISIVFAQSKKVESIKIIYDTTRPLTIGSTVDIGIIKKLKKGKVLKTKGFAGGKEGWENYHIDIKGGIFSNGILAISNDIRQLARHQVRLSVYLADDHQKGDTLTLSLNYQGETLANFKPATPNDPSNRGQRIIPIKIGGTGSSGKEGYKGEDGFPGDIYDVYVKLVFDTLLNTSLLKVYVKNNLGNKGGRYLVNPENGFISILAEGGDGANGGDGGRGVDGKDRSDKNRQGGDGSDGGRGGDGGNGGDGASVTVYIDPSATMYQDRIKIFNLGGRAGLGGQGGNAGDGGPGNPAGNPGNRGENGINGIEGKPGPVPQFIIKTFNLDW